MIGQLSGTLLAKDPPWLVVDVHGVGYELEAPLSTIFRLGDCGAAVTLHTHLVVRDDAHLLYGFGTAEEKTLFRALIRASGVGPKLALVILSGLGVADFWRAVRDDDAAMLVKLPGIGRKTAERLLVEMRDHAAATTAGLAPAEAGVQAAGPQAEARAALLSLGYKAGEAEKLIDKVWEDGMDTDAALRAALRQVVR